MDIEIEKLAEVVKQAGELIMRRRTQLTSADVSHKSSEIDIVTAADRESEAFLREHFATLWPDITFYGEESANGSPDKLERVFIVDPIDGTTNYLHGYPFYCISVGLRENGVTTAGVVHVPYTKDTYTATRGGGAFKNGERLHVSNVGRFTEACCATGFACVRSGIKPDNTLLASEMARRLQGFRRSGSAAIDLCHLAEGVLDAYWEFLLKPWDYEAGRLLVEEAGGMVTGFDGKPVDDHIGRIIASNGRLHPQLLEIIQDYLVRCETQR